MNIIEHKKTTSKEVAAMAEVSVSTVSRVVNHEPNVSANTREKVQAVIERLNYQPNDAARQMALQRAG